MVSRFKAVGMELLPWGWKWCILSFSNSVPY
jgi:hypothetical protein